MLHFHACNYFVGCPLSMRRFEKVSEAVHSGWTAGRREMRKSVLWGNQLADSDARLPYGDWCRAILSTGSIWVSFPLPCAQAQPHDPSAITRSRGGNALRVNLTEALASHTSIRELMCMRVHGSSITYGLVWTHSNWVDSAFKWAVISHAV